MDTTDFLLILFGAVLGWVGSFLTQTYQAWLNRREAERQQRLQAEAELRKLQLPTPKETRVINASRYKPLLGVAGAAIVSLLVLDQLRPEWGAAGVGDGSGWWWLVAGFALVFVGVEAWRWRNGGLNR